MIQQFQTMTKPLWQSVMQHTCRFLVACRALHISLLLARLQLPLTAFESFSDEHAFFPLFYYHCRQRYVCDCVTFFGAWYQKPGNMTDTCLRDALFLYLLCHAAEHVTVS